MKCSILEILRAAESPEGRFLTLEGLVFMRDKAKKLIFFVGNGALTFRVLYGGLPYALRCYTTKRERLRMIYEMEYFKEEFNVGTRENMRLIDIVLTPWIEGVPLSQALDFALNLTENQGENLALWKLSRAFDEMALSLVEADWAHGDLSPNNIIVTRNGKMQTIDRDACFLPHFEGLLAEELGTPAYQSRLRRADLYSSRMDDFSICVLSVSLAALFFCPSLARDFADEDAILINGQRVGEKNYPVLERVKSIFLEEGDFAHFTLAHLLSLNLLYYPSLTFLLRFIVRKTQNEVEAYNLESFEELGRWGYIDRTTGEIAIPPMFEQAFEFEKNTALVRLGRRYFWIDSKARQVFAQK